MYCVSNADMETTAPLRISKDTILTCALKLAVKPA